MTGILIQFKRCLGWKPSWLSLFSFTTKKHLPTLCFAILFASLASASSPVFATLLGEAFNSLALFGSDQISAQELIQKTKTSCIKLACLGVYSWVCNSIYFILFVVFGELQVANARSTLFNGLLQKDQEWFETQPDGARTFLSCLQAQIYELQKSTSQPLGLLLQYSFRAIGSLALAFYTSWNLSLVTLAGIPVFSAMASFISSKMKLNIDAQQAALAGASKVVNSTTTSIDTVKCLNGEAFELRNFSNRIDEAASQFLKQARLNSIQIALIRLMTYGMFVQGFWYGSSLASSGRLSPGDVLRTFWACLTAAQSIEFIMTQVIVLDKGAVAASALKKTLNQQTKDGGPKEMEGAVYPRHCDGDIEVSDLSFAYSSQPERLSLNSASFFFPAGETTFVIGKSGSGKSTLGQLLTRIYSPTSGGILIDGTPIQTLSKNWIRNNFTLVEQRSILFNESIFMNIAFGRHDYDQIRKEDVQECIDLAMLQSVIAHMPNGIDTCVGYGGSFLSGGQRQRVAIARARLRDTPVLILDEPTSALDGANRHEVIRAIREWRKGKTTIIITHDMSHILDRDFVYVLDQGSVVQAGYRYELEKVLGNKDFFPSNEGSNLLDDSDGDRIHSILSETTLVNSADMPVDKNRRISSVLMGLRLESFHNEKLQPRSRLSIVPTPQDTLQDGVQLVEFDPEREGAKTRPIHSHKLPNKRKDRRRMKSLFHIMLTIVPNLTIGQRVLLLLGVLFTLCHSSTTPIFAYFLSKLQVTFFNKASALKWALAVLGVSISDGMVSFFMHYLLNLCSQAWVDCLRKRALRRVLDQPKRWFEEEGNSPSHLTACLARDGEEMREILSRFGGYALVAASIAVIATVWSLAVCWKLTLVALSIGPVVYAITRGFERTSGLWDRRCNEARGAASEVFVETFSEIRTVRTLTLEPFFQGKHTKALLKCLTTGLRKAGYTGFLFGLVESTIVFVSALIIYYGGLLVSVLEYTVEDIMTVLSMLLFSIGYASVVLSWIPQISASRERGSRLLQLANLAAGASHEHLGCLRVATPTPIKITRLSFQYPSRPNASVLKDVSFTIPGNTCTAVVGRSGSGKSTIASLLLALYETPASDSTPAISLGGVDIRKLHAPTLRSVVAIVSQQPTIFPGTIEANINYGLEGPLRDQRNVRDAAKAAGIDEFVSSLPQGYSTVIGDGGVGLSGGQAQRVVIARALVRRPQILVLDEATSALDPASAEIIRHTVQRLVTSQVELTVIIITHAKGLMEIADNVVVLEHGRVVESGPYKTLAKRPHLRALINDKNRT
ncbi:P-loop containing nucleoside triphosphate hydrolase protein [Aspergillus pseudonomiae]|uniref:P-loop containing nucleoside triphosphate hydrolase protein n=1 Tax=Aspergillus pseudonomiae TaxID=1506151 RepID=A0A5N6IGC2_9EURO|nr:P-loop containing nucleoside triphosphate hydrolase protein [Aspergillus pseudonomiae]KAB8265811.1 P-loop containing nucleoside triphosphate hydrolase protein [Aspergillus pseudonomiae]KAE8401040.1 P-loop containing nucleoside triphosphate hydrolase protein [Aspergillus pseudonomiae]